jgi:hypothetical protein
VGINEAGRIAGHVQCHSVNGEVPAGQIGHQVWSLEAGHIHKPDLALILGEHSPAHASFGIKGIVRPTHRIRNAARDTLAIARHSKIQIVRARWASCGDLLSFEHLVANGATDQISRRAHPTYQRYDLDQ